MTSDYFTTLALRTGNSMEAVQPRLPSRFASQAFAGEKKPFVESTNFSSVDMEDASSQFIGSSTKEERREKNTPSPLNAEPPAPMLLRIENVFNQPPLPPKLPAPVSLSGTLSNNHEEQTQIHDRRIGVPDNRDVHGTYAMPPTSKRTPATQQVKTPGASDSEPASRASYSRSQSASVINILQPRHQSNSSDHVVDRQPPARVESSPIVKVHIGRIEVRAVSSPAPIAAQAKRARKAPQLSLEDYLKQRQGGRR